MSYADDVRGGVLQQIHGPFNASTREEYRRKFREHESYLEKMGGQEATHSQEEVTRAIQRILPGYQLSSSSEERIKLSEDARLAVENANFNTFLDEYAVNVAPHFSGRFVPLMGIYVDKCMKDQPRAQELRQQLIEMSKENPIPTESFAKAQRELRLAVATHLVDHADERCKTFENLISSKDLVAHYEEYSVMLALYGQLETEYYSGSLSDRPQEERDRVRGIIGPMSGYQWNLDQRISTIASSMGPYIDEDQLNLLTPDQVDQLETALPGFKRPLGVFKGVTTMYETRIQDPVHRHFQTVPGHDVLLCQNMDGEIISEEAAQKEFIRNGRPVFVLPARKPDQLPVLVYPADPYGKSRINEDIQKDLTPPPKPGGVALFFDAILRNLPLLNKLRSDACKKWTDWNRISENLQERKLADVRKNMIEKTYHTSVEEYQEQTKQALQAEAEAKAKKAAKKAEAERKANEKKEKEEALKRDIEEPRKAFMQNLEKSGLPAETQLLLKTLREEAVNVGTNLGNEISARTRNEEANKESSQSAIGHELLDLLGLDDDESNRIPAYMARSIVGHNLVSLIDKEVERLANMPEKSGVIADDWLKELTKLPQNNGQPLSDSAKRNSVRDNLQRFTKELAESLNNVTITLAELKNISYPGKSIRGEQKRGEIVLAANIVFSSKSQPVPQTKEITAAEKQDEEIVVSGDQTETENTMVSSNSI